jgi:hypothetical protein
MNGWMVDSWVIETLVEVNMDVNIRYASEIIIIR